MKYKVLKILNDHKNSYVSGQEMADTFGISRVSVSKVIKKLKEDGFDIESSTKLGYKLTDKNDVLSKKIIEDGLNPFYRVEVIDSVDSTNSQLKREAHSLQDGYVLVANEQTSGRGRNGHSFHSPSQNGIYFSIFLKPNLSIDSSLKITACSSLAIVDAIEKNYGVRPEIKWVNDVLIQGIKISGILCEGSLELDASKLEYIIVGIGINLHSYEMPEDIKSIAGCIEDFSDKKVDRNFFLRDVLNAFYTYYESIEENRFLAKYKEYSCLIGKEIKVIEPKQEYIAKVIDINDQANLLIERDGKKKILSSGEIHVRKK